MQQGALEVAYAILAYADASRLWGQGSMLHDNTISERAIGRQRQAMAKIEAATGSLDCLLPLLDHEDPAVRLCSALMLIGDHTDRCVVTLLDLDLNAELYISFFAGFQLQKMGVPNSGSGFKVPEHKPIMPVPRKRAPPP